MIYTGHIKSYSLTQCKKTIHFLTQPEKIAPHILTDVIPHLLYSKADLTVT